MDWLTIKQASETLGLSVQGIHSALRRGRLTGKKWGRDYLIPPEEVTRFKTTPRKPGRPADRFHHGVLPKALRALCGRQSAAAVLQAALAEDEKTPFKDSRERALLAACLREQIRHHGWESLPSHLWDRMEKMMDDPGKATRAQVAQAVKYVRLQRGEITPAEAAAGPLETIP
jgi:excisionase family DNA binding protein